MDTTRDAQIATISSAVRAQLNEINEINKQIDALMKRRDYLRMDLNDMREGRLDRIQDRQTKDKAAAEQSVIVVEKDETKAQPGQSPYYVPYKVKLQDGQSPDSFLSTHITSAMCRHCVIGSYELDDGRVVHYR